MLHPTFVAHWLAAFLLGLNMGLLMQNVKLLPTKAQPSVYAEWLKVDGAPTVLIYGHYGMHSPASCPAAECRCPVLTSLSPHSLDLLCY